LVAELTDSFQIRFSAGKAMARPPLPQLTPGGSVDTTANSASLGNVKLNPYRSTNYDLGFEWYLAPESLLSVALFYKDINSYIQTVRIVEPFGQTGLPVSLLAGSGDDATTPYTVTQPFNTPGGSLHGLEVTYQQPFTFLPGFFSNFGTILNYTNVESNVAYITNVATGATTKGRLLNLSPTSYNATLYWENDKFEARVSVAYRDEYYLGGSIVNVPSQNNNFYVGKDPTTNVDAAATWNVNDRMSFTFDGINLTDQANSQFVADQNRTRHDVYVYTHTGREYYFGFRYKY
jgi:TonB-dependent receptor